MGTLKDVSLRTRLSRRQIGGGLLASICLSAAASAAGRQSIRDDQRAGPEFCKSATFVLVPGAFHGGWCYGRSAKLLRDRGHILIRLIRPVSNRGSKASPGCMKGDS
jgi:hypothetical protein